MTTARRLPAEWEPQCAVMLAWPHEDSDWAPWLEAVETVYRELAVQISRRQNLLIICRDAHLRQQLEPRLERAGAVMERLRLFTAPYNDTWVRDYGPISVLENGRPRLLDFIFNGWGGKYPAQMDTEVTRHLRQQAAWGDIPLESENFVLEGGSIDSDGAGTLLTTSCCLLHPRRNPGWQREQIQQQLQRTLGARRVLWLNHGIIIGDDTDGHIDMLARFCDPGTIAYSSCAGHDDAHFEELHLMEQELAALRTADGQPYRLVPLPLPAAKFDEQGNRLPASYANFLVINGAVLVPCYDDPADETALAALASCFPGREMLPIPALPLIMQHGSVHCVTMQLPEGII